MLMDFVAYQGFSANFESGEGEGEDMMAICYEGGKGPACVIMGRVYTDTLKCKRSCYERGKPTDSAFAYGDLV